MLYTDTDSFFLHLFVNDLAKKINARPHLQDAFDFSEISNEHLSNLGRVILIYTPKKSATSKTRPREIRSSSSLVLAR